MQDLVQNTDMPIVCHLVAEGSWVRLVPLHNRHNVQFILPILVPCLTKDFDAG